MKLFFVSGGIFYINSIHYIIIIQFIHNLDIRTSEVDRGRTIRS